MGSGSRGGLEDIVVSTSDICFIDGREGRLVYRGYDVNDLVEHSSFEEVIFLLWHGGLPSKKELVAHTKALSATANRRLPPGLVSLLKALFFFQAEDGIRDLIVTGVQTCALPI